MTRIAIQTLGTRGDVEPFVALGRGLRQAGLQVTLATAPQFEDFVTGHGLRFQALPGDLIELIRTPLGQAAISGRHRLGATLRLMAGVRSMYRPLLDAQWAAAQGVDAIVCHPKAIGGLAIAEKLGIPAFMALPLPALTPTRAFPTPLLPFADLGPLNRASHWLIERFGDLSFRKALRRWRAEVLQLRPASPWLTLRGAPVPKLYPFSKAMVPVPPDWDASAHVTGCWFLDDQDWSPPPALTTFLQAGPPPVYVGFGSLPSDDAARITALVIEALDRAGQRGVLATGWGGLSWRATPPQFVMLEQAPHRWLFPQMAAVVHHGGAGTTAAGLRAGCPSVICPQFGDQPFWGRRVQGLGVGPAPIPYRQLTAEKLAAAISHAVGDSDMRRRAGELGEAIRQEHGVAVAVDLIRAALK